MRRILVAAAMLAALASPARADEPGGDESAIVFARNRSLWRARLSAPDQAQRIADLGRPARAIGRITAGPGGRAIVAETDKAVLLATPERGRVVPVRVLPCEPPAHLSARGDAVLCRRGDAAVRVDVDGPVVRVLSEPGGSPTGFLGPDSETAVVADGEATCAVSLTDGRRRCLVPHSPRSKKVHVAPGGDRAVAAYQDGDETALHTFRLDGRGVRRALMSGARAVAWSADSRWLAVQRGPRACIVRAVGGQYKCWRRYRAIAPAPDGQRILLARGEGPSALYVAPLAGARVTRPSRIVERAGKGAAAWIPPDQSAEPPAP